jgi:hypothetical protein
MAKSRYRSIIYLVGLVSWRCLTVLRNSVFGIYKMRAEKGRVTVDQFIIKISYTANVANPFLNSVERG